MIKAGLFYFLLVPLLCPFKDEKEKALQKKKKKNKSYYCMTTVIKNEVQLHNSKAFIANLSFKDISFPNHVWFPYSWYKYLQFIMENFTH